jgi:lysophospholipid hydrolase
MSSNPNSAHMTGLDNEVEILSFPAGSLIVKAGEKNAGKCHEPILFLVLRLIAWILGLFYVIDGLLDVSIPVDEPRNNPIPQAGDARLQAKTSTTREGHHSRNTSSIRNGVLGESPPKGMKHLFTVKPGGIAGYLASLSGIPSYVDIRAKTDVYVGLLPANSLERLLEKRPIVLLTLAKRLISLLSPLGRS